MNIFDIVVFVFLGGFLITNLVTLVVSVKESRKVRRLHTGSIKESLENLRLTTRYVEDMPDVQRFDEIASKILKLPVNEGEIEQHYKELSVVFKSPIPKALKELEEAVKDEVWLENKDVAKILSLVAHDLEVAYTDYLERNKPKFTVYMDEREGL